jgi:hypothetical protein
MWSARKCGIGIGASLRRISETIDCIMAGSVATIFVAASRARAVLNLALLILSCANSKEG